MPSRDPITRRMGANLPHWTAEGATYSVTFRLADSVPEHAAERLRAELARLQRQVSISTAPMNVEELARYANLKALAVEGVLNECHGECILRHDDVAEIVAGALKHFDGQRYRVLAWCVMPNHVHVVFRPLDGYDLAKVLHSWKSFTAHGICKLLGRAGQVWQPESYDHLVRDQADLMHHMKYVLDNPVEAGLKDWKWVWPVE